MQQHYFLTRHSDSTLHIELYWFVSCLHFNVWTYERDFIHSFIHFSFKQSYTRSSDLFDIEHVKHKHIYTYKTYMHGTMSILHVITMNNMENIKIVIYLLKIRYILYCYYTSVLINKITKTSIIQLCIKGSMHSIFCQLSLDCAW